MKKSIILMLVMVFMLCFSSLAFGQDIASASEAVVLAPRGDILGYCTVGKILPASGGMVIVVVSANLADSGTSYGYTFYHVKEAYSDLSSTLLDDNYRWRQTKITYAITNNGTKLNVSVEGYLESTNLLNPMPPKFMQGTVTFDRNEFFY